MFGLNVLLHWAVPDLDMTHINNRWILFEWPSNPCYGSIVRLLVSLLLWLYGIATGSNAMVHNDMADGSTAMAHNNVANGSTAMAHNDMAFVNANAFSQRHVFYGNATAMARQYGYWGFYYYGSQ